MTRQTRRRFLQGASAAGAALPYVSLAQASRRPNIVFILADDLGYADLSSYGRRDYRTPIIDGLAREGLRMTQAYSNSSVCTPTRVALITGRYRERLPVGLPEPISTEKDVGLPPDFPTLPRLLKRAGYTTSLVGKWHIGWPPEHGPLRAGYDRFFGIAAGAADYFGHGEAPDGKQPGLYEQDSLVKRPGYLTDLLAERAVEELRRSAASGRPFFLSLHFNAPHWPWEGPNDIAVSQSITDLWHRDGGSVETYGAMVGAMDRAVGRVLGALAQSGAASETIVVFTSDNGGERYSDVWPLRGGKGELLEGGIRVPAIVRWPGRIPVRAVSDQVMASFDWLPTLAAAAGAPVDAHYPPDGEDLLGVLAGREPTRPRRLFWRHRGKTQGAVRDGDWKYLRYDGAEYLFNIPRDPREQANLKQREQAVFNRLRDAYNEWNSRMLPYPAEKKAGG